MKILILNNYYKPERAASTYLFENIREAFAQEGFDMSLYAPVPTRGVDAATRAAYSKRLLETEYGGKLTVHRFPLMQEGRNPLQRALRYGLSILKLFRYGCREKDADVLFITSTPPINGLMFRRIKKKTGCKVVYNLQDVFPDSLVHTGLTKKDSLLWKLGRRIEDRTYRDADRIVVISEDFKRNIMEKGVPEEKITVIRNWVDESAVTPVSRAENGLFDEYGLDRSRFYITYSGNIGHTQNMDMLLDVAKSLSDHPEIGFVLMGDGAAREGVAARIKAEGIANVTMMPFQPYERISEVFSLGDCGLIISKPGVGNNSVPSKTWSIMSAERPVLASFDKGYELDRVIREADCGVCVQAGDAQALREAILELAAARDTLAAKGANGRRYILENLTRAIGTGKWVDVMKAIADD